MRQKASWFGSACKQGVSFVSIIDVVIEVPATCQPGGRIALLRRTKSEAASVLGISVATLKRDWEFGKAFIARQLG